MKKNIRFIVILFSGFICNYVWSQNCDVFATFLTSFPPCPIDNFALVWQDDFNGSNLDLSKWQIQPWGQGALNGGPQLELNTLNNVTVQGGICTITAKKETVQGLVDQNALANTIMSDGLPNLRTYNYTSSNIWTTGKFFQGKYEARIKIPSSAGIWPAFWTFGGTRWNEIDIFDNYSASNNVVTDIHHDYDGDGNSEECIYTYNNAYVFNNAYADDWHIFTLIFDFDKITWKIDGTTIRIVNRITTVAGNIVNCGDNIGTGTYFSKKSWPLENMNLIFNLAIGSGNGPCPLIPNSFTSATMQIDYVKFYKRLNCSQNVTFSDIPSLNLNADLKVYNFITGSQITLGGNIHLCTDADPNNLLPNHLGLTASYKIQLNPGFSVCEGNNFTAFINPNLCSENGLKKRQNDSITSPIIESQNNNFSALNKTENLLDYTIFPNPSRSIVNINFKTAINNCKLLIFNPQGLKIFELINLKQSESINLSDYENGVYCLVIIDEKSKNIYTNKVIKQ